MLNKVLEKINMRIRITIDDIKILIETNDKFSDVTLNNVVILITCVLKGDNKFYQQIFLEALRA